MADLLTQNDSTKIPLNSQNVNSQNTSDSSKNDSNLNSSPQNIDYQNPTSIQVNHSNNHSGANITYKTPFNAVICLLVSLLFILSIGLEIFMVYCSIDSSDSADDIYFYFLPLILLIISIIIGSCSNLYYFFDIDTNSGLIYIYIKKMCCCLNKKKVVLIKNIIKIFVQTDIKASYKKNGVLHKFFEIVFVLNDGTIVKGCSGVADINEEGKKAFSILRYNLPINIIIVQNLICL